MKGFSHFNSEADIDLSNQFIENEKVNGVFSKSRKGNKDFK